MVIKISMGYEFKRTINNNRINIVYYNYSNLYFYDTLHI